MEDTVKVLNRFLGTTTYVIPELHIRRTFQRGAEQDVPIKELKYLKYQSGGEEMLQNVLMIRDQKVLDEILGEVEPEYHYTEKDVEVLLTEGSLAQLQDALDFAPLGVIELIKDKAVSLNINDMAKREAIQKKTDFDVTKAIKNIELEKAAEAEDDSAEEVKTGRRTAPLKATEPEKPERRVAVPKYKILDK